MRVKLLKRIRIVQCSDVKLALVSQHLNLGIFMSVCMSSSGGLLRTYGPSVALAPSLSETAALHQQIWSVKHDLKKSQLFYINLPSLWSIMPAPDCHL